MRAAFREVFRTWINQVLVIVDTNDGDEHEPVHSTRRYTHFSLLKTLEAAFGLPCLNHACDAGVAVMDDLFRSDR